METANPRLSQLGDISHTSFSLVSIKVGMGTVNELEQILTNKVDSTHGAYNNASVVLNIEDVENLNDLDYYLLKDVCKKHNLYLMGVTGVTTDEQVAIVTKRRIPIVNSIKHNRQREENIKPKIVTKLVEVKVPVPVEIPFKVEVPYQVKVPVPTKIVRRNIRSGETIAGINSSVAIYGSVGAHAKIMASNHIYIFGSVKGADIIAGAPMSESDPGFIDAMIHIQGDFNPGLISIAGNYLTAEDIDNDSKLKTVLAKKDGLVITLEGSTLNYSSISDYSRH